MHKKESHSGCVEVILKLTGFLANIVAVLPYINNVLINGNLSFGINANEENQLWLPRLFQVNLINYAYIIKWVISYALIIWGYLLWGEVVNKPVEPIKKNLGWLSTHFLIVAGFNFAYWLMFSNVLVTTSGSIVYGYNEFVIFSGLILIDFLLSSIFSRMIFQIWSR
jgi:hypothetical protein